MSVRWGSSVCPVFSHTDTDVDLGGPTGPETVVPLSFKGGSRSPRPRSRNSVSYNYTGSTEGLIYILNGGKNTWQSVT